MQKNKWKLLVVGYVFIAGLALNGCGKADTPQSQSGIGQNTEIQNEIGQDATNQDAPGQGGNEAGASGQDTTEQEVYVLEFEATTTDGEEITSDVFAESKLTMINVWATYCNPCLAEMPDLGEIATEYDKADFQMIGIISDVMSDGAQEDIDYAKQLIAETGAITYPHLTLNTSLYMNLVGAVDAVPTTFFFNQKGELLGYLPGAQAKVTWKALIDDLLAAMEQKT